MSKSLSIAAAVAFPSLGPAIISISGFQLPVAATALSIVGLLLARFIAPKAARKLTDRQEHALTGLLIIILLVIVSGKAPYVGDGIPLEEGPAVAWGIGLGTSGLLVIEFLGGRIMHALKAMFAAPSTD